MDRPDPDELLDKIQREEEKRQRGRLKAFFGASAGVGKTFAMLQAAQRRREEGVDVAVGVVVDELAHSNVQGSRHLKRWQDMQELLDAGIDVYTTVNVHHLESLDDIVGQITGHGADHRDRHMACRRSLSGARIRQIYAG
jgi:two-component system, OmpR family, sensor histidine kinase KdpD